MLKTGDNGFPGWGGGCAMPAGAGVNVTLRPGVSSKFAFVTFAFVTFAFVTFASFACLINAIAVLVFFVVGETADVAIVFVIALNC